MFARRFSAWISGFALFSMFFGAGNLIFPLLVGQQAGANVWSALGGLLITAVAFPIIGLLAMMFYRAETSSFFGRIGRWPGWLILFLVYMIQGPLGVIPRLLTVSFGSLHSFLPGVGIWSYSAIAAALTLVLALRKGRIITLIGAVFTPILLASLGLIIIVGLLHPPAMQAEGEMMLAQFSTGLRIGYGTSDLVAAFIFAPLIMGHFMKRSQGNDSATSRRWMIKQFLKSSVIAMALLALVYGGLCLVASHYAPQLTGVPPANLLQQLAFLVLGPYGSLISSIAAAMACFTTALSLSTAFSEYIQTYWFQGRVKRTHCLVGTLAISALIAPLGFDWIMGLLGPVLEIIYPGLIVLCVLNIAHKLVEFRPVKFPVMTTFGLAALGHFV